MACETRAHPSVPLEIHPPGCFATELTGVQPLLIVAGLAYCARLVAGAATAAAAMEAARAGAEVVVAVDMATAAFLAGGGAELEPVPFESPARRFISASNLCPQSRGATLISIALRTHGERRKATHRASSASISACDRFFPAILLCGQGTTDKSGVLAVRFSLSHALGDLRDVCVLGRPSDPSLLCQRATFHFFHRTE